ncbi:MAG: glucosaminidase domain-containing protein [Paludibacteraceae bacterium]|jgi:tetratricopeptide (TPR) repeat protein|nr:glucosaminidase domain-containing protein [Paludibacteraceae bacterium]
MKKIFIITTVLFSTTYIFSQQRNADYEAYIEQYSKLAVIEQDRHKIPASVTLAQGLLESSAGKSRLATAGNNHFGIKCSNGWTGDIIYHDDERHDECFRKYDKALDSYEDHSLFLKKQRYAFLFDYDITDYKAWANGLRIAGYATDPKYPAKLVKLIEDYELYRFDTVKPTEESRKEDMKNLETVEEKKPAVINSDRLFGYVETNNNGIHCIRVMDDENSIANLSQELGISEKNLLYYNDMAEAVTLHRGDFIYLWLKRTKAEEQFTQHTVTAYESMHSISQQYGIRLKSLYKMNEMEYGTPAKVGMILKLR